MGGVALLGLAAAACGSSSSTAAARPAHPSFSYLQTDGSQSYFVLEGDGATAEAAKLGATVKMQNESSSSATTISDIQTDISEGVNGLIVVAPAASLGSRMVTLANNAHIPIMSSDNGFAGSNGKSVPFVGINAQQFGTSTGSLLMSNFAQLQWPAASTDMLLVTNPALPTCNDRTNAEEAKVIAAGFPKSQILNVPTTDNTTEQAFTNTGPVKTANPTVQYWLVAGCNDDVAFGAAKALVSAGVSPSNVDAVGLGGDLACQIWAAGEPNVGFRATNYINASGIGSDAVHEMYENVAKGVAFPPSTAVTPISMTQANYQSIDKC